MATIADALTPTTRRRTRTQTMTLVAAGAALVALSARIRFDLPFTPVPITGQTFGVLLIGASLGARRGAASLTTYLAAGAVGLPVFAGGTCCLPALLGPTGGYLLSYPLAAGLVGYLAERGWDRRTPTTAAAMLLGNLAIYAVGLPWLALFVGVEGVLVAGFLPFVPGDAFKLVLAAVALPGAWKVVDRARGLGEVW